MSRTWWEGFAELAPGALSAHWQRPTVPDGRTFLFESMALRLRSSGLDLGNPSEVEETARLFACVRQNSYIEIRVEDASLIVIRADEIPSPFGVGVPVGTSASVAASRPFKDVTISGNPIKIKSGEALEFKLGFIVTECKCPEPHSKAVLLQLSLNGKLDETERAKKEWNPTSDRGPETACEICGEHDLNTGDANAKHWRCRKHYKKHEDEVTEETTTKIDEAFDKAWDSELGTLCTEANATWLESSNTGEAFRDVIQLGFAAGARAFSTMPLCKHGVAVWGIETCGTCSQVTEDAVKGLEKKKEEAVVAQDFELVASLRDKIDKLKAGGPGEFPGYNRPFEAELPEGMTAGHLADLQVEHETMRRTLLQLLVKVGALDPDAVTAPWDAVNVVHFSGLWLADGLPFAKSKEGLAQAMHKMLLRVEKLENAIGSLKSRVGGLEERGGTSE